MLYLCTTYKFNGIPQKNFDISQKEVRCIYVYFVNGIPQKEFAISQKEVLCIYVLLVNKIPHNDVHFIYV